MASDDRSRDYAVRQTAAGRTKKEIIRLLKRAIAREVFRCLTTPVAVPAIADLRPARQAKNITLTGAAHHFNVWPAVISCLLYAARPVLNRWLSLPLSLLAPRTSGALVTIVKHVYDARWHHKGTVGRRGSCSWHGQEACAEHPTSSYETPNGMMAACPRAERQIEDLYGYPANHER
jgi:hypothetical protein